MRRSLQKWIALAACLLLSGETAVVSSTANQPPLTERQNDTCAGEPSLAYAESIGNAQTERHRGTYDMGVLAGRPFADLYGDYVGFKGRVPARLAIDWDNRLDKLWEMKTTRSPGNHVVFETALKVGAEYHMALVHRMSLADYQAIACDQAKLVYDNLDWEKVGKLYHLNAREVNVLKVASKDIRGRVLISYMMTELLPSRVDGAFNAAYMDFLLRNAGREYVERLPAIHDKITSFGPYQFTSFAVFDANGRQNGASLINRALPREYRIPGSVNRLRGDDHFRAAFLFGVANLAIMIRKLDARELAVLERIAPTHALDLAQFMATAHNKPAVGFKAARRWLDNKARSAFYISLPTVSRIYATKTVNNFRALAPTRR